MRLSNPLNRRGKGKDFTEDDLIQIRHDMMCTYGWISKEQFKKIGISEMWDLYDLVKKEREQQYKKYYAIMKFAGAKKSDI